MSDELDGVRKPNFSQRYGHEPFPPPLQLTELDERTRTDLWNLFYLRYFKDGRERVTYSTIWMAFLARYDSEFSERALVNLVFQLVADAPYARVFDLVEFFVQNETEYSRPQQVQYFNKVFELNRVGYRIGAEWLVAPIIDAEELKAVDQATQTPVSEIREHIRRAVQLFTDRDNPQYAKSIQESMNAAEGAAQKLAGSSKPLGAAVDKLVGERVMHGAMAAGFKGLYGYTSQDGGIRHPLQEGMLSPTQAAAQFFLVTCSAFVNFCDSQKSVVTDLSSPPDVQ